MANEPASGAAHGPAGAGVTLITGASSGIGRSLARRMAVHGPVAVLARRGELLDQLVAEIAQAGGRALAVVCDVTDAIAMAAAVARVEAELGPVERLIANAGGGTPSFVDAFDAGQVEAVIRLNLVGTSNAIAAVLPGMLARGRGQLVATGSLAGRRGLPTAAAYSAAKAGVANLMESLRVDLKPRGITVTLLEPGFVRTKVKPGKKRKPLQMDLETATARMERGILAARARVAFPWSLRAALAMMQIMPRPLYDALLSRRGRKMKG